VAGNTWRGEIINRRKDGKLYTGRMTITPVRNTTGNTANFIAIEEDITERKELEKVVQRNIELESTNIAKDRFLASMSHELRTPLNAIIGFTGALLMKLAGPLTEEQSKQLKTIRSSANHLLSLISDLLDVAKVEADKIALTIEAVVLQNVVEEVRKTLLPLAEKKRLALKVVVPEAEVVLHTDRRAFNQILLNLTSNA